MNVAAIISYDGTNFHGFQMQEESRTVQMVIEQKLREIFGERICVNPAGRTDAGVHALGQVISFKLKECPFSIEKLHNILNFHLPNDIRINELKIMPEDFNSRFFCKVKGLRLCCLCKGENTCALVKIFLAFRYIHR